MAMLQRDAAIAERNAAIQERDEAITAMQYRENSVNEYDTLPDTSGNELPSGDKHIPYQQVHVSEAAFTPRESSRVDVLAVTEAPETAKSRKGRQPKDGKPTKSAKSARIGKRSSEGLSKPVNSVSSNGWNKERVLESNEEDLDKPVSWKDNLGLNQISF
ncbi:uncharacterized protein, partial [Primulina huaijiensis]|uniref:uncharacterized protein n=1 Tax=Primulina huaijiensis TaxID=1492673 RepID=UPI003CC73155